MVRQRAAELLGDFDDLRQQAQQYEVTEGLIGAAIEDEDDSVRARAIDSLYRHGQASLGRLVERLAGDAAETGDRRGGHQLRRHHLRA